MPTRSERADLTGHADDSPVLVTGASGAIGRFVVDELLARGRRVVVVSRQAKADAEPRDGLAWHVGDIQDVGGMTRILQSAGVTRIIHLAAAILNSEGDLPGALAINTGGAAAMFEAARRAGVARVVYTSSKAVFGPLGGEYGHPEFRPVPENHPRNPQSIYALTKCLAEDVAAFYRMRYGLEIVSVRFGTTSGPGKGPQHAGAAMLSRIVEDPVRGVPVSIPQGGDQRDDIMYTLEVAQGLVTICLAPGPVSAVLHLDSGELVTLRDIAAVVKELVPDAEIDVGDGLDYMGYGGIYCRLDGARARSEVGYAPRFDLRGWLADYVARTRQDPAVRCIR
jgi:UDP-glucose 4-epimerase